MTVPSPCPPPAPPDPLNRAAQTFLPPQARYGNEAPLVSLMRLGLDQGLLIQAVSPSCPDPDQIVDWIDLLSRMDHTAVAAFLSNPERTEEDCYLSTETLTAAKTPQEAAAILLDALVNSLTVCRRP